MTRIGGKNGDARMQQMLERLAKKRATPTADATAPSATTGPAGVRDGFAMSPAAQKVDLPLATQGAGPGGGLFGARMAALTGDVAPLEGPRRKQGAHGPEVHGDITVHSAQDLQKLHGAVAVYGHLAVLESDLGEDVLAALQKLEFVDGNLALEGNFQLTALTALASLQKTSGSVYVGYNDMLTEAVLPQAEAFGRGLIFEGNAQLTQIHAPALTSLGGYLHLHENPVLVSAQFPLLTTLGGEISILDNPRLTAVQTGPVQDFGGDLELGQNGAPTFKGITIQ